MAAARHRRRLRISCTSLARELHRRHGHLDAVQDAPRRGAGDRPRLARDPGCALRLHRRRLGLRQVDAAQHHGRPRATHLGRRRGRRATHPRPGHRPRHGLPVVHALPLAARTRERRVRPEAEGDGEGGAPADLGPPARPDGARRVRPRLPQGALGRDEAARGDRPRAGERPGGAPDGRALRRARRTDTCGGRSAS